VLSAMVGLAGACSCDDPGVQGQRPRLVTTFAPDPSGAADYLVDFGEVTVGARAVSSVEVTNEGNTELRVVVADPGLPFSVEGASGGMLVEVSGSLSLHFGFAPKEPTAQPLEQVVALETNERGRAPRRVRIKGKGVTPALRCEPDPLDFGRVIQGEERTLALSCENPLDVALHLGAASFRGSFAGSYSLVEPSLEGGSVEIPGGERVQLQVRFRAGSAGKSDTQLALTDVNEQPLATVPLQALVVTSALVVEPAGCLDFGYVEVGGSSRRSLQVQNIGSEPLQIGRFALEDGVPYTVHASAPLALEPHPADAVEVEIEFHPTAAGRYTEQLQLVTDGPRGAADSATACVTGIGGGPRLSCTPDRIDFGKVAVGIPVQRRYLCTNDGEVPEGVSVDPLVVEELSSTHPAFRAQLVGEDGAPVAPRPEGYEVGETFFVGVEFESEEEGLSSGEIVIRTNVSGPDGHATRVFGEAQELPDCDFSVIPPNLHFGTVSPGQAFSRTFTIVNHLESACLINDLRLADESDPYFSLTPIESAELGGHQILEVPVLYQPFEPKESGAPVRERSTGAVVFQISNRETPSQRVPLLGMSGQVCVIVEPTPVDFDKTGLGCMTNDRTAYLVNVCGTPVNLTGVSVDETYFQADFHLRSVPRLPHLLGPGEREELTMRFAPSRLGRIEGLLAIEVDGDTDDPIVSYVPLVGEGATDLSQTEVFTQPERSKVDVLWVIDNSGSMGKFQEIIRERLPIFISFAMEQDIDYRIAITSTGIEPVTTCQFDPALGAHNGRFVPIDADTYLPPFPRILGNNTPNLDVAWKHNVRVGVCHGIEKPYEAALRALSPPLINEAIDSRPNKTGDPSWNDGNAGFLRPNASLAVVVVTDEMDQSWGHDKTPRDYLEALRNIKGPQYRSLFRFHAITVPAMKYGLPTCGDFRAYGDRLLLGVEETEGTWFNICTDPEDEEAWDAGLRKISEGVFSVDVGFRLRGQPAGTDGAPPQEQDLVVRVGGVEIPPVSGGLPNWTYDRVTNTVSFEASATPQPGTQVSITYQVACLTE